MTQTEKIISVYQDQYMWALYYEKIIKHHKDELNEEFFEYLCNKSETHRHASRVLVGLLSAGLIRKYIPPARLIATKMANETYENWLKDRSRREE